MKFERKKRISKERYSINRPIPEKIDLLQVMKKGIFELLINAEKLLIF
jgi:hypothetical protein